MRALPLIRSHERMDYKRCPKKWYWKWRKGYVPKVKTFGALEFGGWMHEALALYYTPGNKVPLRLHFLSFAELAYSLAANAGASDETLQKAEELIALGEAMCDAYERHYQDIDAGIHILGTEIPLEFSISDDKGNIIALHMLKPDLVYRDQTGRNWLMEHKTAKSIRTDHLVIDDQARPYGVMAERALKNSGVLRKGERIHGIMYNYLRKGLPDLRPTNAQGQSLNKDGSVSKAQPALAFLRKPVLLSARAKMISLKRIQTETYLITLLTQKIRAKTLDPSQLPKTPHYSCPRTCDFFSICVAEEEGTDIRDMIRSSFVVQDPYDYGDSTDEFIGFE